MASKAFKVGDQAGAQAVEDAPMPRWGWGETHGPYEPVAVITQSED
jgi:hemoglobin